MSQGLSEEDQDLIGEALALLLSDTQNMIVTCPDVEAHQEVVLELKQRFVSTVVLMQLLGNKGDHLRPCEVDLASDYRRELLEVGHATDGN